MFAGAACLPFSVGKLMVDVFYYLDKSSKRQAALKCMQVLHELKATKMLKHVATRWLSVGKCLPRIIASWNALFDFFSEQEKAAKSSDEKKKTGDIRKIFSSPTNKLYCMFLIEAIAEFEKVNTELQSDAPKVAVLQSRLQRFLRDLFTRFVKPSAMAYKHVLDVNFTTACNIYSKENIIVGEEARVFIENGEHNKLRKERVDEFFENVVNFYKASCTYLKKKLPLDDELLKHAQVADPARQVEGSFSSVRYFLSRFPKLKRPDVTVTELQMEFAKYQSADIRQCMQDTDRMDATWMEISKLQEDGSAVFKSLPMVMMSILTIPHSSAHCERIFSIVRKNKTDFRGSMGSDTLEAIVVAKSRPGTALDRKYSDKDLKDMKSSYYRSLQSK